MNLMQLRPHQERSVIAMQKYSKGQLIEPTGAGKTLCMIHDSIREFLSQTPKTVIVVCPRILLAEQLSSEFLECITNASVFHVHSGETSHESSTRPGEIKQWISDTQGHKLIFTTYHSLSRLEKSEIDVDTIYFDEAHNSVQRHFYPATEHFAANANRCYFFTATRKTSLTVSKPGMNDAEVYGQVICQVSAPELVAGGYIVPPKMYTHKSKTTEECGGCPYERDKHNLTDIITQYDLKKVLVVSKKTKDIMGLISETDFLEVMQERGYDVLHISSKYGAFINKNKVNREQFFDALNSYGKDVEKKFIVLNHSILGEGLNISCLNGVVFQRSTDYINILQNVGRTIRMDPRDSKDIREGRITPGAVDTYSKSFGLVIAPVFDKVGISTARKIEVCLDTVFAKGDMLDSVVRR
jgi:superfamily II DNA or RNA helicase